MNILVLFSYGSLRTIDDVAGFYNDIFHGRATVSDITAGGQRYESYGMTDPLGSHTKRIGLALTKRFMLETGEEWEVFIGNHHAIPSIETVAKKCAQMNPKRVVTFGLTPFNSITGNDAYERTFRKHLLAENKNTPLIHIPPYCEHELFIKVLTDRVKTARDWLSATVRNDAEIIFTMHSMPGIPKAHEKMIKQYERLTSKVATSLEIKDYHLAYRSGQPEQRWLEPDVLDVVAKLGERSVPAIVFVEVLSVIENMEVIQEITQEAIEKAQKLGIKAVQSEYLNDSIDFIEALEDHTLTEYSRYK